MQIEQSFRDRKSFRNGWSLRSAITRSCARLEVILLLASLAEVAVTIVGRAVAASPHARQFQANTVRTRRVLSFFFLGCRAVRAGAPLDWSLLLTALETTREPIHRNAVNFAPI
ncbi:MAG TPA: hypothetical protein VK524_08100 [Polyangiaceae bacterium]|nr:hypothetical protein [Polyangiaceae bacterium]